MAASLLNTNRNLSLYTIPVAWTLCLAPHMYAATLGGTRMDKTQPRSYTTSIASDKTLSPATRDTIIRAEGAQQNGFENLGLFAAAVVAGNVAGLENGTLNALSIGYLASRVVYNLVYIGNTSELGANLRSTVYTAGIGIIFTLFIKSGNAMKDRL